MDILWVPADFVLPIINWIAEIHSFWRPLPGVLRRRFSEEHKAFKNKNSCESQWDMSTFPKCSWEFPPAPPWGQAGNLAGWIFTDLLCLRIWVYILCLPHRNRKDKKEYNLYAFCFQPAAPSPFKHSIVRHKSYHHGNTLVLKKLRFETYGT